MARMDAPSKISMKGIGVSSKWSYQRPELTEQIPKLGFRDQFLTQSQALTVGPHLIGASPVWAARNSYWRSRGYLYLTRGDSKSTSTISIGSPWPPPIAMLGNNFA